MKSQSQTKLEQTTFFGILSLFHQIGQLNKCFMGIVR